MREVCSLLYLWLLKVEWSNMKISHISMVVAVFFKKEIKKRIILFLSPPPKPPPLAARCNLAIKPSFKISLKLHRMPQISVFYACPSKYA